MKKIIHETGQPDKTTLYISGVVYENDQFQFIPHEEGRIRLTKDAGGNYNGYAFDYFVKDHLGNVRMVLTDEQQSDQYEQLTFEDQNAPQQNSQWENRDGNSIDIANSRTARPGNFGDNTANGSYAMLVRKTTGAIGAGKLLKVMSGDRIHTYIEYYYTAINSDNSSANGINSLITNLTTALGASSQVAGFLKGNASAITTPLSSNTDLVNLLNTAPYSSGTDVGPKAYLHVLFFDERFEFDKDASFVFPVAYSPNLKASIDKRFSNAIEAKKSGYAYIYFSNESNEMVYFDNFMLTHERGRILEETHYYPFGLTMTGISSKAAGSLSNRYKFNDGAELSNKEFADGSGLELYETAFRSYDPQIGRFHQLDILADYFPDWSPYAYANDNPILLNDPLGLASDTAVLQEVVVVGYKPHAPTPYPIIDPGPAPSRPSTLAGCGADHPQESKSSITEIDLGDSKMKVFDDISSELYLKLIGWDPHDFFSVLQHTVVDRPDFWGRIWNGPFYRGENAFGEKLFNTYYGGTAPSSGSFNRIGGFVKLFKIRSARSWEELFQWGTKFDILQKLKNVSGADVLRLKNAGVTLEELKLWSSSYAEAINKISTQSNIIAKYRKDLVDKLIELW